jgi:dipeptidyl aminopeptidase/acylaminoacyl peptidase
MTQPLTPEALVYGLKTASDAQIAPDSAHIAYVLTSADEATHKTSSQLWLCDRDGSHARQLTHSGEHNGAPRWSPDGRQMAFVSDRGHGKGSGLYVLPLDAFGEAREVTRHNQGIGDLAWSPDGARIAYVTDFDPANPDEQAPPEDAAPAVRATTRRDYKWDGRGWVGDKRPHVFVVDVATGERRRVTEGAVDHGGPRWSPDGRTLAIGVANATGSGSQLLLLAVDGDDPERRIGPEDGQIGLWSWSPVGDRLIYASDPRSSYQSDLFVYDLASGAERQLTDDLEVLPASGYAFSGGGAPVWLDERQVLFHAQRSAASGLHIIDSESGAIEPLHRFQALTDGLSLDAAHRYIAQTITSFDTVGEVSVFDLEAGAATTITAHNRELLAERPPAQWERFEVERGGLTIEGFLLKPHDFDANKQYPLVLDIHGGPNWFYGYWFWPWQQVLATHGILVAFANPRGSTSYGRDFTQRVTEDWGGEDFKDLMAVTDMLAARPYVDAERLGMHGYSYGGYMTSWMLGNTQRFKACCCGAPCFDFESFWGTSDIGVFFGERQFGGQPSQAKEKYAAHSPSAFIHNATTPTLIIHGEADDRCPIGQGEQLFVSLVKAGVEVEFARYPGGDHLFIDDGPPEHRADYWRRLLAWMQGHLGGPV